MRQKDQTKKAPTGTFQRDNLLAHLEKQAKEDPDKEDLVPFTGEKRGELELQQLQRLPAVPPQLPSPPWGELPPPAGRGGGGGDRCQTP